MNKGPISEFIQKYYLHFNAAALVDAAKGYEAQFDLEVASSADRNHPRCPDLQKDKRQGQAQLQKLCGFHNPLFKVYNLLPEHRQQKSL